MTCRCRRSPPIPDKLKGTGELRIAGYGGTAQDAERKAYFEPFGKMSGIKVHDFPGADLNKVKAMVETGNVEWDVVQLSHGSVTNLRKHGDYFEKIDYDLVDTANIEPVYRSDYALRHAGVGGGDGLSHRRVQGRGAGGLGGFLGHQEVSRATARWAAPARARRNWNSP